MAGVIAEGRLTTRCSGLATLAAELDIEKKSLPCVAQKRHNLLREDSANRTGNLSGAVGVIHIGRRLQND